MEVFDLRIDELILEAELQRVALEDLREIHARIHHERVLMLWVGILPAPIGVAGDLLCVQSAAVNRIFRNSRDSVAGQHARRTEIERRLAALGARDPEPHFYELSRGGRVRRAERELLIQN